MAIGTDLKIGHYGPATCRSTLVPYDPQVVSKQL